jgi:broad specificity phosphatase PhoE
VSTEPVDVPLPDPPPVGNRLVGFTPDQAPPTTFVAVRHGVTAYTIAKRFCGSTDAPLSDHGVRMAEAAAQRLVERAGVSAVVTSPLARARRTAEIIAAAVGGTLHVEEGLRECDFGAWEGLTFAEAKGRDPELHAAWLGSEEVAPPGGESFAAVGRRVEAERAAVVSEFTGATVVLVSHVTPIKMLLRDALQAGPGVLYRLHLDLAALSIADFYPDGGASVRLVNDTSHHPAPL